VILEAEASNEENDERDVGTEQVETEPLDIEEKSASLCHRRYDRIEVTRRGVRHRSDMHIADLLIGEH
jgi:hypothetical protein